MAKNIASFDTLSDNLFSQAIEADIKKIADPSGFIGKNLPKFNRHCEKIYVGTDNLTAFVGDGVLVEDNLQKDMEVSRKKNQNVVTVFNTGQLKDLEAKFPSSEFKWMVKGEMQLTTCRIEIKNPVEVKYRPKARTFKNLQRATPPDSVDKKSHGIMGDLDVIGGIDGMKYSLCPELQPSGMKIMVKNR